MKIKYLVMLALALLLCCPAVLAAQPPEEGYILCLKPGAELTEEIDAEPLIETEGLYYTEDLSLVEELEEQGVLESWEEDTAVCLFGYAEDLAALQKETWSRAVLGADYAAARGITGKDSTGKAVRVAVVDAGMAQITGLKERLVKVYDDPEKPEEFTYMGHNYVNDTDTFPDIYSGHGTFVSSLIASAELGLAPEAELVPLKCFSGTTGSMSLVIAAIGDAVDKYDCDIINLSLGETKDSDPLQIAVAHALEAGVIVVASCGNLRNGSASTGNDPLYYPASCPGVVSVASVNGDKTVSSFSSQNESVWVTAPGDAVKGMSPYGGTRTGDGTSYSAPMVTAAAALALSADRSLTPEGFLTLLAETAEDLGPPGRDNAYGYGLLNLGLLLAKLTGDSESVIPSCYSDTLCLSSWQPGAEGQVTWMARYEESGRFFSLEALTGSLNNAPLTADVPLVKLLTVKEDVFAPVRPAAAYGFDTPAE